MKKLIGKRKSKKSDETNKVKMGSKKKDNSKGKNKGMNKLLGLKTKIAYCYVLPIIFMTVVGLISYSYASEGMAENFKDTSTQTANMAVQYLDTNLAHIEAEGLRYAFDADLNDYTIGMGMDNEMKRVNYVNDTRTALLASQTANDFIANIHVVTRDGIQMITSYVSNKVDGFYKDHCEELLVYSADGKNLPK